MKKKRQQVMLFVCLLSHFFFLVCFLFFFSVIEPLLHDAGFIKLMLMNEHKVNPALRGGLSRVRQMLALSKERDSYLSRLTPGESEETAKRKRSERKKT